MDPTWGWLIAGAAGVATFWSSIRGFLDWLITLVIGRVSDTDTTFGYMATSRFAWYSCWRFNIGTTTVRTMNMQLKNGKEEQVTMEVIGPKPVIFFHGLVPLLISKSNDRNGDSGMEIRYIRGTINPDNLLKKIYGAWLDIIKSDRFFVTRITGSMAGGNNRGSPLEDVGGSMGANRRTEHVLWSTVPVDRMISHSTDEIGQPKEAQNLDDLSLSQEVVATCDELKGWLDSRDWYTRRGIPWRRGLLLSGPPGSGKSSLVRALGIGLNVPVFVYDLATLSNTELALQWADMRAYSPCIALIEDIDAVFDKRENLNKTMTGGLTFDCLLNCISGVQASNGVICVLTTNDLTKIDPALYDAANPKTSRPGRIDRHLVLNTVDKAGREKIAAKTVTDKDVATRLVREGEGDTAAQFVERCIQTALAELQHVVHKDRQDK